MTKESGDSATEYKECARRVYGERENLEKTRLERRKLRSTSWLGAYSDQGL